MLLNLNADLGESYGPWTMGDDAALLSIVNSANIACGFHAGDPLVMQRTVRAALGAGVSLGAHPSYADLQGFGRRAMSLPADEVRAIVVVQTGALAATARAAGGRLTHVKPHGALNNQACEDAALARTIAEAIRAVDAELILLAPALSQLAAQGRAAGLRVADEVFADRAYRDDATLVPRSQPGAVLDTHEACLQHVRAMIEAGGIVTQSGRVLPTTFHSICVHGDNAHAVATARSLRDALRADGHTLAPLPQVLAG